MQIMTDKEWRRRLEKQEMFRGWVFLLLCSAIIEQILCQNYYIFLIIVI